MVLYINIQGRTGISGNFSKLKREEPQKVIKGNANISLILKHKIQVRGVFLLGKQIELRCEIKV